MDFASLIPMFLMMQILPLLTGGGGCACGCDGNHHTLIPVEVGKPCNPTPTLPAGIESDRRNPDRRGRRDYPGGGRRGTDTVPIAPHA